MEGFRDDLGRFADVGHCSAEGLGQSDPAQLFFDLKIYVELRDQKARVSTLLSRELGVLQSKDREEGSPWPGRVYGSGRTSGRLKRKGW